MHVNSFCYGLVVVFTKDHLMEGVMAVIPEDYQHDKEVQFSRFGNFLFWLAVGHLCILALMALFLL
ncbi:hypothetical protein GCM10007972_15520 [Iodidimonas muriae]|uniref:Uncharacterized protein n=1 Tax=Iodidimonas muriae TaxID=261467 RepID=A0ABQ2LD90_9PROT|nr:hypothetical protein JCM17843_14980 [Kordiimonadales bacterium JCM 17843]GGO11607.1 hypothetical protein GCM10007972_15520 [Iodidimonas muriae]